MSIDISNFKVMRKKCITCPFNENGDLAIRNNVMKRILNVNQICHHNSLNGKPHTHLCRGARDEQLTIFHRLGVITQPTDEAWNNKLTELRS